jgi:hypothetical protein
MKCLLAVALWNNKEEYLIINRKAIAVLICLALQPWFLCVAAFSSDELLSADAAQTADILGIRREAEQIVSLRRSRSFSESERHQFNTHRALVLRKVFEAVLQVKSAENRLELEMAYAYDVLSRERRKIDTVNQLFNGFNFAQLSVLYGFIEPYSRLKEQFIQSAVGTCVGSGLAIGLPLLNIMYNKFAKASHLAPPEFLSHILDGKPVDGSDLPPLVARYLDSPVPGGSSSTRREILNSLWKQRYHADMDKKESLCGINDEKGKSTFVLNTRIVLLWSLYTAVQNFNGNLLSLLNQVADSRIAAEQPSNTRISATSGLGGGAAEAARLLQLESVVGELRSLDTGGSDAERKRELRIFLLERLLSGFLDIEGAADRCQQDLNYQYDVVLSQMTARRGKFLQKTYEANFIQTGTIGACAGWSYLKGYSKAGNQLFIIADAIGVGITTLSLLASHGGWRRNQSEPNSLADFFDLQASSKNGFSPLVLNYLNSAAPERADGKSRRQYLLEVWSKKRVVNIDVKKASNLEKLGSMPSCKWDTIKLVLNRIALLSSLREQFQQFDAELLELLRNAWPETIAASSDDSSLPLSPSGNAAAKLLGITGLVAGVINGNSDDDESSKLLITRHVMESFLNASADSNLLGHEIVLESQMVNRMDRQKDMAIQLTNVANFYQLGILGMVSDSMGLSSVSKYVLYADRINIVSGYLIASLALAAFLERKGGPRLGKAKPNAISAAFGKSSDNIKLSPVMIKYLNSPRPQSSLNISRREELIKYWKESKILSVNIKKDSTVQKLSAEGRAHHWWCETINLINNRITMLYDLRAVLRSSSVGFDEILKSLN